MRSVYRLGKYSCLETSARDRRGRQLQCDDQRSSLQIGDADRQAAHILRAGRGQQWEAAIVDAFLHYLEQEHPQAMLAVTSIEAHPISPPNGLRPIVA